MDYYPSGSLINNRYEVVQGPREKKSLKGGMGLVYLCADQAENGRPVALKTFQPQFLPDRVARDRFLREGDTWLKLGYHPHIVRCYEVFGLAIGPEVFFALELVAEAEGKKDASLRAWLRPEGIQRPGIALPLEQALRFALHMVRGMKQATTKISGLVHRDLKPENVLVGRDGNARITDFGLASAFQAIEQVKTEEFGEENTALGRMRTQLTGGIAGTPLYMAPEQWRGEDLDVRTDIYAVGCILYEMLTGQFAVDDGSHRSLKEVHQQGWFAKNRDKVPPSLVDLLGRCVALPKEERFKDWAELESVLMVAYEKVSGKTLPLLPVNEVETVAERVAAGWSFNAMGISYSYMGKFTVARDYFQRVLSLARREKDKVLEGATLGNLGLSCYHLGEVHKAIEYYEQHLSIASKIGDHHGEGNALNNLGLAYADLGEVRRAIGFFERKLSIAREIGDRHGEGNALGNLGLAYAKLGEGRKAIGFFEQKLSIAREIDDRQGEGAALGNLGLVYADLGEVRRAISLYEQLLSIAREIGDRRGEGRALGNLGLAYAKLGELRQAINYYEQSLSIAREIGDHQGEGNGLGNLGAAYYQLGELQQAIDLYEQLLSIAREIGDRRGEDRALGNLGLAYADLGEVRKAIDYYEQALDIAREIGDRQGEGQALGNLGAAYYHLGEVRQAIDLYEQDLAIAREIGDVMGAALTSFNMALLLLQEQRAGEALSYAQYAQEVFRKIGHQTNVEDAGVLIEQIKSKMS